MREMYSLNEAAIIRTTSPCQVERSTVVHGCANDRQTQRDIDAVAKAGVFQNGQTLVMVHRKHSILVAGCRGESSIGRNRTADLMACRRELINHRRNDVAVLMAQVAIFSGINLIGAISEFDLTASNWLKPCERIEA